MSKITIIGIGANGIDSLTSDALRALKSAEIIFGGKRHLDMIDTTVETIEFVSPFIENIAKIKKHKDKKVLILATGNANYFGVSNILYKHFNHEDINIINNIGCISLSAMRMGWAEQDIIALSIHGRKTNSIIPKLYNGAKLIIISNDHESPIEVCKILKEKGFEKSQITILNYLNSRYESIQNFIATNPQEADNKINCIAIECKGAGNSLTGGLNDENFINDGQLTKREVRAITISSLQPYPNAVLWDVGSGSGSISIEWCRLGGVSYAFEINKDRCENIKQNCINLGVENSVNIINSTITDFNDDLPQPDCIFIGGGVTKIDTEKLYEQLKTGGRLVINSATIQGIEIINKLYSKYGGEISRISIERSDKIGSFDALKPMAPVTHYVVIKD